MSKGKYPVLRVGNFYTNDKWYFSDLVLPEKFYANKGDLLYTWSATFGPHIWEGDKVIYHYHIWKLLLEKDTDKAFLLSLLQRDRETLLQGSNGSTMIHITKQAMEAKKLFFPRSQEEQRQIGSFFKTIDKAITLHQRNSPYQNQLLTRNEVKKFLKIKHAWEQCKLGDIAKYKKGPFGSSLRKEDFVPKDVNTAKIYEQRNVIQKNWRLERYFITLDKFRSLRGVETGPGDILISCAGTIGELYELPKDAPRGLLNQALMRVRVDEKIILKGFFKYIFLNAIDKLTAIKRKF